MEIGKYTYGTERINIMRPESASLKIGNFCSIGENITIWLGGNHRTDWITTYPFGILNKGVFANADGSKCAKTNGNVVIGNDVWIGNNVTIMSGVKIGDGACIAANSHVVSKVKPYSIVGGNPATFYYFRFNQETINDLLKLKWWNLEDYKINEMLPLLCSGDYENLLKFCREKKYL